MRLGLCAALLGVASFAVVEGTARADTAPPDPNDPKTPVTVSADALPTAQLNGVGWDQTVIGNTVYVVGSFTKARPAGAAAGTQEVTRNNILAYNITTGALISSFAPSLNGQAYAAEPSPDGSVLYVGGTFTTVNGASANRIVALDPTTGARIPSFNVTANSTVHAIVARGSTVWIGGEFSTVNGATRTRLAAVNASNGSLLPWAPVANRKVNALELSPDGTKMVVGGQFTTLNGSSNPGYGLGAVDAVTGASLAFPANTVVRDAGDNAAILALSADANNVYASGFVFGSGGNLEGAVAIKWSDFTIAWLEDCHGDTYMTYPSPTAVYTVGHAHYCVPIGGYPETNPRTWHRAMAFGKAATGTVLKETFGGYFNFQGQPSPSLLNWFPDLDTGTYTGQSQGPWAVEGNSQYIVLAGEFRHVNGTAQQGMVRFAISSIAPNKRGPQATDTNFQPTLTSPASGQVKLSIPANYDQDNTNLTYRIYRDGASTPVTTFSRVSTFWTRPTLTFTDTGLSAGTHSYRVSATDPFGNTVSSPTVSITIAGSGNAPPVPSFTATTTGLEADFNASGSHDPDGTITSYAWDFGDGQSGTGVAPSHTYATSGSYVVTLNVTDNSGATAATSKAVQVSDGAGATYPLDSFSRTVSNGWGTADVGGAWSLGGGSSSALSVNGGAGHIALKAGGTNKVWLPTVQTPDVDVRATLSLNQIPDVQTFLLVSARRVAGGGDSYSARVTVNSNGTASLTLLKTVGGANTALGTTSLPSVAAGEELRVRLETQGSSPTAIRAKVWDAGSAEPSGWQLTASDSAASLQGAGGIGFVTYLSSGAGVLPTVDVDDLAVSAP